MVSASEPFLSIRGLRKVFAAPGGTTVALNGIDLEIARGSFVSIIGPSGCGKSTLLQIMAGLAEPTSGAVFLDGRKVEGPPRSVIYVFQQYTRSLFPWKTVERNVAFGLENRESLSRDEIASRTREIIALVKLTGFERHYPWQLSGGMQQRVAIARALACRPEVLLMDEPFSAVDALTRVGLQELLRSLWRELGLTVVFVTHDVDEGVYLSTRVVALSRAPGAHRSRSADRACRTRATRSRRARCRNISTTARVCWRNSSPTKGSWPRRRHERYRSIRHAGAGSSPSEAGRRHCLALEDPLARRRLHRGPARVVGTRGCERLGALAELSAHERGAGHLVGAYRLRRTLRRAGPSILGACSAAISSACRSALFSAC